MRPKLEHQGRPIEWGAEKEIRFDRFRAGGQWLAPTVVDHFEPELAQHGRSKAAPAWEALDDRGKARYLERLRHRHPDPDRVADWYQLYPKIEVVAGGDVAKVGFEAGPYLELISPKLAQLDELRAFTGKYGWGHVHTSFSRGMDAQLHPQLVGWFVVANLYLFLDPLEKRGIGTKEDPCWRFNLVGLSVPTAEHLEQAASILAGQNHQATAFNKHLGLAMRGDGVLYGDPERIGLETRGGVEAEKRRVLESMLHGLVQGQWGKQPWPIDADGLGLLRLGPGAQRYLLNGVEELWQPERVPPQVEQSLQDNLQKAGLDPALAPRLYQLLDRAELQQKSGSQLGHFDQRVAVPLLQLEQLPGLSKVAQTKVIEARAHFLRSLVNLERAKPSPKRSGPLIAELVRRYAQQAALGEVLGKWLDGEHHPRYLSEPNRRRGAA